MGSKERRELLTSTSDSLTESFGQKSDVHLPKITLFDNYDRGKLTLHLYFSTVRHNGDWPNGCLEMHRFWEVFGLDVELPVLLKGDNIAWSRTGCQSGHVDFPVFVVIREATESQQPGIHRISPTIVRLQALDDCYCFKRDSEESITPNFLIEGTSICDKRKLVARLSGIAIVELAEEFANKVIQARIRGLEDIAKDMGDLSRGATLGIEVAPSHSLRVVISLDEELSVFCINVLSDCLIENIEMVACPLDLF